MNEPFGIAVALKDLKQRIDTAVAIIESDIPWEIKYTVVFSRNVSARIFTDLKDIGLPRDYYDPDTSHEEDVMAYKVFLDETLEHIHTILVTLEEAGECRDG
jgi:hypothetical protein